MKKPTIVILHGWGLSGDTFQPLMHELKRSGYSAYAPDFPGFGKSIPPKRPLTLRDYAVFLKEYLEKKKIIQPVLIGHSFGGRVALKYIQLYPQTVTALVLTGVPGFTPISRTKLSFFIFFAKVGKLAFSVPPLSFIQDSVRRWYYYVVGAKEFYRAQGAMRETFKRIVQEDLVEPMRSVRVPCALIWGELDQIVPVSIAYRMKEVMPKAKLIFIPATDHGVPFKEPQVFAVYAHKFIASL